MQDELIIARLLDVLNDYPTSMAEQLLLQCVKAFGRKGITTGVTIIHKCGNQC